MKRDSIMFKSKFLQLSDFFTENSDGSITTAQGIELYFCGSQKMSLHYDLNFGVYSWRYRDGRVPFYPVLEKNVMFGIKKLLKGRLVSTPHNIPMGSRSFFWGMYEGIVLEHLPFLDARKDGNPMYLLYYPENQDIHQSLYQIMSEKEIRVMHRFLQMKEEYIQ